MPDPSKWSWELPAETGLADFNSENESEEEEDPGQELFSYLLSEHSAGKMTAKQVCIISWWAAKAGVAALKPIAKSPATKGSGDFKRTLDKYLQQDLPDSYSVPVSAYSRASAERMTWQLQCVLPHEMLQRDLDKLDMKTAMKQWEAPPNWQDHPVVKEAASDLEPVPIVPLSLFIDGVSYAKRDSLLVISLTNLLSKSKFVVAILRKRMLCKCGCFGWCTLHGVFVWLKWALTILREGRHPAQRHDKQAWAMHEEKRLQNAGQRFGWKAAVLQLRADWAEIAHTLQVPQWSSAKEPCFLCAASREQVFSQLHLCSHKSMPWPQKSPDSYDEACKRCELDVEMTQFHWDKIKPLLQPDVRSKGARGLALICAYAPLALKKGDRVEPTPEVIDVYEYLEMDTAPSQIRFWRRKAETQALRRNPLLTPELGLDLARVVAIDAMHTLCLGVHHQFVMSALWWYVDTNEPPDDLLRVQASRHSANMSVLAKDYKAWTQKMRQTSPDVLITPLGDLNMEVIGTKSKPILRAKAHETLTLLRWLSVRLQEADCLALAKGTVWGTAATALMTMWQRMSDAPMVVPKKTRKDHGK